MLYAVVEVDFDVHIREMMHLFLVLLQLCGLILKLFLLFRQLDALGGRGVVEGVGNLRQLGAVALLLLVDVVGAQPREQVALIAVHIDESLEAVLLSAVEKPVNRAFLIGFEVVGVKTVQKIAADDLAGGTLSAEGVGDEFEVFLERIRAVDRADELNEAAGDVVVEILVVADGDNVVGVGLEGFVFAGVPFAAGVGEAVHVERIAAEHAADRVGHERNDLVVQGADVVRAFHGVGDVVAAVEDAVDGDVLVRDLGRQLVRKAVNVDENAVERLLVGF